MTVITRFAPSPTGFLHIGGARTALFNWVFAKSMGGKMLLRIEDTDRKRSTQEAVDAIYEGLQWLGVDWDGEPISQFARADRHREIAEQLLAAGHAYRCYATPEELTEMREAQKAAGQTMRYDGRWRDRPATDAPVGVDPVIRLKAPQTGETVIEDKVQGHVTVANAQLDDMILLRSDGTPTYMLAVVVDDHDMGVTHVIRGDDHLTNAFRQRQIIDAMGWDAPTYAHIPLIHGADGAKLSKRHGALGVEAYRDMGMLPEALRNYLLRLGWGYGDEEYFTDEQAREWFSLEGIGKAPARFDLAKLTAVNAHHLRDCDDARLLELMLPFLEQRTGSAVADAAKAQIEACLHHLKPRAKNLMELAENTEFFTNSRPLSYTDKAAKLISGEGKDNLRACLDHLGTLADWQAEALEAGIRALSEEKKLGLGKLAQPLRAAITGTHVSPPIFDVMAIFGKEECLARIQDALDAPE